MSGNVRSILDKLIGINAGPVRGHENWQDWDFPQLIRALKSLKEINPVEEAINKQEKPNK